MSDLVQVEEPRADFFVTGNEYMLDNLDLRFIPRATLYNNGVGGGVILADNKQDLQQSFSVAKDFFERTKPDAIKFVLIGLSPAQAVDENVLGDYFKLCLDKGAKPAVVVLPVNADVRKTYNADTVKAFRDTINKVRAKTGWRAKFIDLLDVIPAWLRLFKDETHLNEEGKAAVTALLSSRLYVNGIISPQDLCSASDEFFNLFAKYFPLDPNFPNDDKPLIQRVFCIMVCDDFNRLSKTLPRETCMDLMVSVFSELTYSYLANLVDIFPKDDYNELTTRLFKMTIEKIHYKDKIKVGYYFDFSSQWPGDDLFNLFAQDERFEPTIFVPVDGWYGEFDRNDYRKDSEKFKARGLNVLEMKRDYIPERDILFRLRPYTEFIPPAFRLTNLKVKETLLCDIPYSSGISNLGPHYWNLPLFNVLWREFLPSTAMMKLSKKWNKVGMPRAIYSGYPKMDAFFRKDADFKFAWKMVRPDAKKIIWAPHHSIGYGAALATFQWNYKFMYEFAKAHHEISWVVKPHPELFNQAIWSGVFSSKEALKEYFQKWDDLPNAQVYTGTYYNDIFATSDGMIHDSGSFTTEYQYVDKPMIFLMRSSNKMERFHELAQEILKASYLVDGKDFDGIAAMIQRVFIEGDDYKAAERKEVFDKYLNYPKTNGMLASEFIYKNISQDLECPVENHWQELWNNRKINFDELSTEDEEQLILELKRIVGWDFHDKKNSVAFDEFRKEYNYIKENLGLSGKNSGTVFEVGCGSGANLYFFKKDGFKVGGSDYAENLLAVTRRVIGEKNLIECIAGEAIDLPTEIKYDAIFAGGVFPYLSDLDYAEKVLNRMVAKARHSIGITRILNAETKSDYLKYRREHTKNYDELYKDLPKLFISKKFFEDFAARNNLAIKFSKHHIEGFWNEPFNFDCFMYKI